MTREEEKREAAREALGEVRDGMRLGLGSGSTAGLFVELLAERVARGSLREVVCVASSRSTAALAGRLGLALSDLEAHPRLDLTVDGADEVDPRLRLLKGGGGALLREKVVARSSARMVVIVDGSKCVSRLGAFPLPVEVIGFARRVVSEQLEALGLRARLRRGRDGTVFVTDEGHEILDVEGLLGWPGSLESLAARLDGTSGVVEHGLFLVEADAVWVGGVGRRVRGPR